MRISRSTVLIGILVVLIAFTATWHLSHRGRLPEPVLTAPSVPSFVPKPRSVDEILAAILKPGPSRPEYIEELLAADKSLARPNAASLEQQFLRSLKSPELITADYDVPTEDYVPKGTHAWLQPLTARKVTESEDAIRWFEWLDDDTLVYSTLKGVYRKDLHGPPELLARAPMARASVPCLSPDRRSVAAVVWGGIMVVGTESGEQSLHPFDKAISDITWSPDSRLITFTTRTELWTLDRSSKGFRRLYREAHLKAEEWMEDGSLPVASTNDPQWSPDGRHIAIRQLVGGDREWGHLAFTVVSNAGGRVAHRFNCWYETFMSWSPDSRTIAFGDSGGDVDGMALAEDIHGSKARLYYVGGASTTYDHSAWSPDGKHLAFECVGRDWSGLVGRYGALEVFEPVARASMVRPVASRPLPFAWHPSRPMVANIEELRFWTNRPMAPDIAASLAWTVRLNVISGERTTVSAYIGHHSEIAGTIPIPPIAGRKQTPRWSPDGTKLAVLCDLSGSYQVYVTGLLSHERNARNAETWLGSAREHLKTEEIGKAVACLQNAVRLGVSPDARILLVQTYLHLAESEANPYQRWRLYQGAIHEASNVPFKSLDADLKHRLIRCIIDSDTLSDAFETVARSEQTL